MLALPASGLTVAVGSENPSPQSMTAVYASPGFPWNVAITVLAGTAIPSVAENTVVIGMNVISFRDSSSSIVFHFDRADRSVRFLRLAFVAGMCVHGRGFIDIGVSP